MGKTKLAETMIFQTKHLHFVLFVSWLAKIKLLLPVVPIIMNAILPNSMLRWRNQRPKDIGKIYRGNTQTINRRRDVVPAQP